MAAVAVLAAACAGEGTLDDAGRLQARGRWAESIAPLRALLAANPDLPEASYRLGRALMESGRASEAVWPLHRAAASDGYRVDGGVALARALLTTRNFEEAVRAADVVLAADPDHRDARRLGGRAALAAGRAERALESAERLLAANADDREAAELRAGALLALDRLDEAEAEYRRLADSIAHRDETHTAARACLALAAFHAERRQDRERAAVQAADCRDRHPDDPGVLQLASRLMDRAGRTADATRWWRVAVEADPDDLALRAVLARRLERAGAIDEARSILEEGARRGGTATAWQLVADFHRRNDDAEAAEAALREVAARGEDPSALLRFAQADLLVEMGEVDEAGALAAEIDAPGLRQLMRGRILAAEGNHREALRAFDAAIPSWPNNAGARLLAGMTAERVGDFDRAIAEYRAAVRAGRRATDAALAAARLYLALGRHSYAAEFARIHAATGRPSAPEGLIVLARALTAAGDYDTARVTLDRLAAQSAWRVRAVVEQAALARAATGPREAAATIVHADLDVALPENEPALRALVEYLLEAQATDEAIEHVTAALDVAPAVAALHDVHARVLARMGRVQDARRAFERARALDPGHAPAIAGLATLAADEGDVRIAVRLYDEAVVVAPADVDSRYRAAQLQMASGETDDARRRLEELLALAPTHASACNDLAWLLADQGDQLERALALATRAVSLDRTVDTLDTLGWVRLQRGETSDAVALFEQALAESPGAAVVQAHLADARARR